MNNSFKIGGLELNSPLILAPMAQITHTAFRQLVAHYGNCGLFISEMQPARRVMHYKKDTSFYLNFTENERPFFYQIVGHEPDFMAQAITHLLQFKPDGFDLNMGCPDPRLTKSGGGAKLVENIEIAKQIVISCRKATKLPLTVKLRYGNDDNKEHIINFAKMLEGEGCDAITIHGRTISEYLTRTARWEFVTCLTNSVKIPVVGNGDIKTKEDIIRRFNECGCDGIMIGREAIRRPWIFSEYKSDILTPIDYKDCINRFIDLMERFFPEVRRLGRIKKFFSYFQKNFKFGHTLIVKVHNSRSVEEVRTIVEEWFR